MTQPPKNLVAIVPVWGEAYTRICTDLMLPSLLATGNLGPGAPGAEVALVFACPPESQAAIQACPAALALGTRVSLAYVDNSDLIDKHGGKYRVMTESIYRVLKGPTVTPGRSAVMFLNPDVIVGAGMIEEVWQFLSAGKRAVLVPGLSTRLDSLPGDLTTMRDGASLDVPAGTLSRLALKHLHPAAEAFVWNSGPYPLHWPAMVWYRTDDGSLLMQSFHLHPIALICPDSLPQTLDTVDGAFLEQCGLTPETVHVARDGESLVVVEMSGEPYTYTEPMAPPNVGRLANFGVRHTNEIHWHLFGQRITYSMGLKPPGPCTELDRIVSYVQLHRFRRKYTQQLPRLDKKVLGPLTHVYARLLAR